MVKKDNKVFKLGELFCGPGGMAIAAAQIPAISFKDKSVEIFHVWGVDRDEFAIQTFKKNLSKHSSELKAYHCDVADFLKNHLTEENRINALAFGFPCNSFSAVGEQKGLNDDEYGQLYKAGIKVIEKYDVDWFIAENVSGIKSSKIKGHFKQILDDLANSGRGYRVVAHLYKFEEYGVPQNRHRMVIVGIRSDYDAAGIKFKVPAPTHGDGRKPYVTVEETLEKLSSPQPSWGAEKTAQSEEVLWRLLLTAPGKNAWDLEIVETYDDERLLNYIKKLPWYSVEVETCRGPICLRNVLGEDVQLIRDRIAFARLHVKSARMSHIYKRLEADKPSYTLTGSGGGGTHLYHWFEPRALTNCERAALQSFPHDFEFVGPKEAIRKQIGMAVPTRGASVIFDAILKTFLGKKYDSLEDCHPETFVVEVSSDENAQN